MLDHGVTIFCNPHILTLTSHTYRFMAVPPNELPEFLLH